MPILEKATYFAVTSDCKLQSSTVSITCRATTANTLLRILFVGR